MTIQKPSYKSPNSVGQRKAIPIDINDPRLRWDKKGQTIGRSGAQIIPVDITGNTSPQTISVNINSSGATGATPNGTAAGAAPTQLIFPELAPILLAADSIIPPDPIVWITTGTPPADYTQWTLGGNLHLVWQWDSTAPENTFAQFVVLTFTSSTLVKTVSVPVSQTYYDLSLAENRQMFGLPSTTFTVTAVVQDAFGNQSTQPLVALITPTFVIDLPTPAISVNQVNNGYTVGYTKPTQPDFTEISVEEVVSTASSDPGTGYSPVYTGVSNPVTVICSDTNYRWVRARFTDGLGNYTAYSNAYYVQPKSPVQVNNTPPTDVTINNVMWSGNNIVVSYTLPSSNQGVRFILTLNAPDLSVGYFYFVPDETGKVTISDKQMIGQFGKLYSQFTGLFQSASSVDARSAGVVFNVPLRSSSLTNPAIAKLSQIVNGYILSFENSDTTIDHTEIYEFFVYPSSALLSLEDFTDFLDATSSGTNPANQNNITLNNFTDENGSPIDPHVYVGYKISGYGVPDNSYITAFSGSGTGPYTVTINNNLTQQASGIYHMQGLAASGSSPLQVYSNFYQARYLILFAYDEFGNRSPQSSVITATPINPTAVFSNSAIQIAKTIDPTNPAAIYMSSANSLTSGSRVLLGTSNSEAGIFVWGPNDSSPSTQIIADPASNVTFITQNAQIADWAITPNKIESTITTGITRYTGLSASNTNYAFWAGAISPSNSDNTAPFSVTPHGAVNASNIKISGGSLNVGGNFSVDTSGILNATGATIDGTITARGGSFSGNVQMTSGVANGASIYSGTLDSSGNLASSGYILNSNGLTFSDGTTNVTTVDGSTGLFLTQSANIGGWIIDSSTIHKTTSTGTITLDSSNSWLSTKNALGNYYSAFSNPFTASDGNKYVMWAGASGNTASAVSSANFRVGVDGTLYATGAVFDGSSLSSSLISLSNSAATASAKATAAQQTADAIKASAHYNAIVTGAAADITSNNTKITGGNIATGAIQSTTYIPPVSPSIYSGSGMSIVLDSTGSIISPNFVLDASGNIYMKGALTSGGVISGSAFYINNYNYWNYNNGVAGGNNFEIGDDVTSLRLQGGAAGSNTGYVGMTTTIPNPSWYSGTGSSIQQANSYQGSNGLYYPQSGAQKIEVSQTGIHINGLTIYGGDSRISSLGNGSSVFTRVAEYAPQTQGYAVGGDLVTGFAVYYGNNSNPLGSGGATTGFVGDLWVEF